jgi:hypothetical protein
MCSIRTTFVALAVCLVAAAMACAEQPTVQPAAKADARTRAQVQAEMHRTMADLIEARSAPQGDQAKIQALVEKVQKLRTELAGPVSAGLGCPWGGPGRGYGRGAGWGAGRGWGPGRGWGFVDANNNGICDRFEAATGQK